MIRAGEGKKSGASSIDLPDERKKTLPEGELQALLDLADRAWREERSPNPHPTADYDEILILADGDDTFFLEGFGPLRGGAAEKLIAKLRAASK
jgi:hypothetical protein